MWNLFLSDYMSRMEQWHKWIQELRFKSEYVTVKNQGKAIWTLYATVEMYLTSSILRSDVLVTDYVVMGSITHEMQRFFPSEFGNDVDRVHAVEPAKSSFAVKAQIRRAVEAEGIPHTYVSCSCFAGYFLPTMVQPGLTAPPRDKVVIMGDGNAKGNWLLLLYQLSLRRIKRINMHIRDHSSWILWQLHRIRIHRIYWT